MESCSRKKDENWSWLWGRIWSDFFLTFFVDSQKQVAIRMCGFNGVHRGNYFRGEMIKTELQVRVRKINNGKYDVKEKILKVEGDMVVDWIRRMCNIPFGSGVVLKEEIYCDYSTVNVKERRLNVGIIKLLASKLWWGKIGRHSSKQIL